MTPAEHIRNTPFLRILVPVLLGVVAADALAVPLWALCVALAITYAFAWATLKRGDAGWLYAFASLMLAAMVLTGVRSLRPGLPEGEKFVLQLTVTDNPAQKGRWNNTTAEIGYYRRQGETAWRKAGLKIMCAVDTCYKLPVGSQVICRAYVNPIARTDSAAASGYARLMGIRGYGGKVYITPGDLIVVSPEIRNTAAVIARKMQRAAVERLSRLGLGPDEMAVATTMTAGDRRTLPPALKENYSRTGASHLLSVSGLHVGIVFVLINALLYLLPVFRYGHVVRSIAAILAVWTFAAMTGLSPSAMRAAMMFSGVQIALAATQSRNPVNILLATATVMLLLNPYNVFDVSFQLSMMAVLFISLAYRPVFRMFRTRNKLLNGVIGIYVVGLAATIGTAPLVAWHFGNFSLTGVLLNLPVILAAHFVVLLSVAWIIAPIGALSGIMGWLIGAAAWVQNGIIEWCARLPFAAVEFYPSGLTVALIYVAYLAIFVALSLRESKELSFETA